MANVEFTGFVNKTLTNGDGQVWLLKTAEPHRRENDKGEWETTARTFRDVLLSRDSDPDMFAGFTEGDRVTVKGYELTVHSQSGGNDYYNLTVYADSIELLVSEEKPKPKVNKRPASRR